jgi:hypothetical protein
MKSRQWMPDCLRVALAILALSMCLGACAGAQLAGGAVRAGSTAQPAGAKEPPIPLSIDIPVVLFRSGSPTRGQEIGDSLGEPRQWQVDGLEIIRNLLLAHPQIKVRIVGFTDSVECDATYCEELSLRRAEAVRVWMIEQGVRQASLTAMEGWGAGFAVADDATLAGRQANRRVEFHLVFPETW